MRLTVFAVRKNSPCSGRSLISSAIVCDKIALRHGPDHAGRFDRRMHQIADERVDRVDRIRPRTAHIPQRRPLIQPPGLTDHLADPFQLADQPFLLLDHFVECVGNAPGQTVAVEIEPHGEISLPEGVECHDKLMNVDAFRTVFDTCHR